MTTNTIYKSPKYSVETKDNDYRYVQAKKQIKKGELLLVEHCHLSESRKNISSIILHDCKLFDNLFPRKEKWTEKLLSEEGQTVDICDLVYDKANKNMFCYDSKMDKYVIGLDISNFNHSSKPNAYVKNKTVIIDKNVSVFISYVISDQDINIDEEIKISYGYGLDYFSDPCMIDYSNVVTEVDILVEKIMRQYLHKQTCLDIIVKHISIFHGLYIVCNDGILLCQSKRFMKTFNNGQEFTLEDMNNWVYEKTLYYHNLISYYGF